MELTCVGFASVHQTILVENVSVIQKMLASMEI